MIRLAIIIVILAAGLIIGPDISGQQGYMLLALGDYTIETTATIFFISIILFYVALLVIEWLLGRILGMGHKTRYWFVSRRRRKALNYTQSGMQALVAEDYAVAEKMLLKGTKGNDLALLNYLNAATAAQELGHDTKRDDYLRLAQEQNPDAGLAVGLTQTRLQYQHGQLELALAGVQQLSQEYGNHPALLKLQKDIYLATGQWQPLISTLDTLASQGLIETTEQEALKQQAYVGWFNDTATTNGSAGLIALWQGLSRKEKYHVDILVPLCERLITLNADKDALQLLLDGLSKKTDPRLLACMAQLQLEDYHPLLATLEKKANKEPSAELHSTLGQLYLKDHKPEQAEQHLQQAIALQACANDYLLLAKLAEQRQDVAQANEYYRHSLGLTTAVALVTPETAPETESETEPETKQKAITG
ncbi:heme biosynthesis HemY N-terminal domain-containing protein [Oceanisphaera pacifica]|uniref:Heme biosynthesis protein HemY n=1 Tax=Oceanisphaera pacifica TaxID=2818389 RepID=A0ABS3NJT9_9GAMM|nr:heme biosynthesis HemY N-terminal domain-containing protein [Oceanisphaera pacifica]MBO1520560.1 heme biosynthesis protein HemY [Oceanisphaera pacifica]